MFYSTIELMSTLFGIVFGCLAYVRFRLHDIEWSSNHTPCNFNGSVRRKIAPFLGRFPNPLVLWKGSRIPWQNVCFHSTERDKKNKLMKRIYCQANVRTNKSSLTLNLVTTGCSYLPKHGSCKGELKEVLIIWPGNRTRVVWLTSRRHNFQVWPLLR